MNIEQAYQIGRHKSSTILLLWHYKSISESRILILLAFLPGKTGIMAENRSQLLKMG
jgi:hypothetical protein